MSFKAWLVSNNLTIKEFCEDIDMPYSTGVGKVNNPDTFTVKEMKNIIRTYSIESLVAIDIFALFR